MKMLHNQVLILFFLATTLWSCSIAPKDPLRGPSQTKSQKQQIEVPQHLQSLLMFEQLFINRTVDTRLIKAPTITELASEYRPENQNWFRVRTYWIPESELLVAEAKNNSFHNPKFVKEVEGIKYYRLIVHPESEQFYQKLTKHYQDAGDMYATSTSSSRTVLMTDKKGSYFFAKLSLNVELGGVIRTIPKGEVVRSVGITRYVDNISSPNSSFEVIREPLGIIPKGFSRGGQILREIPTEALKDGKKLVPLFSLYSQASNKETLLERMLRNQDPEKFINKEILLPFVKAWLDWAIHANLVMEAHAQNVLIQLDDKDQPTGKFYHRDLGGFNVNFKKSDLPHLPKFTSIRKDYHLEFSDVATIQSLRVYFEGGFLFNLNNELVRLGFKDIDLRINFRKLLIRELEVRRGYRISNASPKNIYSSLVKRIKSLRAARNSKLYQYCPKFLRFLLEL